jgi:hypothetical protein
MEHQEQVVLFDWLALMSIRDKRYGMAYAIPNGGLRNVVVAMKLKREGLKPAVPDICLPVPSNGYHGLYIEMKRVAGRLTDDQFGWLVALREQGYEAFVCYGFEQARVAIEEYLK